LPIGERIKQAKHLDEKIKALVMMQERHNELQKVHEDAKQAVKDYIKQTPEDKALDTNKEFTNKLNKLNDASMKALVAFNEYRKEARQIVAKVIQLPSGTKEIEWNHNTSDLQDLGKTPVDFAMKFMAGKIAGNVTIPLNWKSISPNDKDQRAFADQSSHSIYMGYFLDAVTAVHEWGHHIEFSVPWVREAAIEFLSHRVGNEPFKKLAEALPTHGYGKNEEGRKNEFDKAFDLNQAYYVGKQYANGDTEIVSMGAQKLYEDPVRFAKNDPEYCKFMLGIFDGSLRKG